MKTLIFIIGVNLINVLTIFAGNISYQYVPYKVEKAFHGKFPEFTGIVNWNYLNYGKYEAAFAYAYKEGSAIFDMQGHLLEVDVKAKWFDMPVLARYYIYNNYQGCTIDEFKIVTHSHKGNQYGIKIHKGQNRYYLLFNQRGDLVKMKSL